MPIKNSLGEVVGFIHAMNREERTFTEDEVHLLEISAGLIAHEFERTASETRLRQVQRMESIGRLAGGVAHDFNNLLTVIKCYSDLLLTSFDENSPYRNEVEEIKKASERAESLTRRLLAFSRRQVLEPKIVILNDLARGMDKMLRRLIREDIDLMTVLEPKLWPVKVDPGQIEQVIMNLVVNARDAMPEGGKLTIETENVILDEEYALQHAAVTPGEYVMLAVSDTGSGMSNEIKDHIFEPFFTTKTEDQGTGLGLPTVYGIVKQSGGNIWVYSEPNRGTTFKIYFPRVEGDIVTGVDYSEEPEERLAQGSETILLAEDEESVRGLASHILRMQGFTVIVAKNGNEAINLCEKKERPIDLLLTDVVMPGMSGPVLAERIKTFCPQIKILYISGYTVNAIIHNGVLDDGIAFLQKPFTPGSLLRKVRSVLDET